MILPDSYTDSVEDSRHLEMHVVNRSKDHYRRQHNIQEPVATRHDRGRAGVAGSGRANAHGRRPMWKREGRECWVRGTLHLSSGYFLKYVVTCCSSERTYRSIMRGGHAGMGKQLAVRGGTGGGTRVAGGTRPHRQRERGCRVARKKECPAPRTLRCCVPVSLRCMQAACKCAHGRGLHLGIGQGCGPTLRRLEFSTVLHNHPSYLEKRRQRAHGEYRKRTKKRLAHCATANMRTVDCSICPRACKAFAM